MKGVDGRPSRRLESEQVMYSSILIPIDLGHVEKSKQAIDAVTRIAGKNTKVKLVNIVGDVPTFAAAELPGGVIEKAKESAQAALQNLGGVDALKPEFEVRSGTPATAILAAADESGADLIVIGSHQPGMMDYLLGSTAARVVRHASCSVLVVR